MSAPTSTDRLTAYRAAMGYALPPDPDEVVALREYYTGDQLDMTRIPQEVRDAIRNVARTATGEKFCVNVCSRIVDTLVAAMNVTGLDGDETVAGAMWELWQAGSFGRTTDRLFRAAAVEREAYLIADLDADGLPTAYVNRRFDGTHGIEVVDVDADGEIAACYKWWTETAVEDAAQPGLVARAVDVLLAKLGILRDRPALTVTERRWRAVYEADRIRWFVTVNGREELDEEVDWPYGMPVVRFTSPTGGELTSTILSLQDLINDAAITLAHAIRTDGFRVLYTMDAAPILRDVAMDDGSTKVGIEPGVIIAMQSIGGKQGAVGEFPKANLAEMRQTLQAYEDQAMFLSSTPTDLAPWNAATRVASGRALQIARQDFDAKVQTYADTWSPRFTQLFDVWQRMGGVASPQPVVPVWARPDYTDAEEIAQLVAAYQSANVADGVIWSRIGLTPEEIAESRAFADVAAEAADARVAALLTQTEDAPDGDA